MVLPTSTDKKDYRHGVYDGDSCMTCRFRHLLVVDGCPMGYYCAIDGPAARELGEDHKLLTRLGIDSNQMCELHTPNSIE